MNLNVQRHSRRKTVSRDSTLTNKDNLSVYAWTVFAAAVILLALFIARGIYPYGDNMLQYADGDQYFSFTKYLQNSFFTNDNLFYTWSSVLGSNMTAIFAFACASPFNLILSFFPNDFIAGYHFVFSLKFLSAALCFSIMARHLFPSASRLSIVMFSACYPYIGYMTYYAWNQSWMDGVVLLPMILLGVRDIVWKQSPLLLILSTAAGWFSNYYIGYMLCICSVLMFAGALTLRYQTWTKQIVWTVVRFACAATAGMGLSAVLLVPTFYAIPHSRALSFSEVISDKQLLIKPAEILSMLFSAPYENMMYRSNYPVIYAGIVQLFLAITFFLNRSVQRRQKLVAAGLFVILFLSFSISGLNTLWHGFTKNLWFNYRYSFFVSFLLDVLAVCSFVHIGGVKDRLLASAAVAVGITLFALESSGNNIGVWTLLSDILCGGAAILFILLYTRTSIGTQKQTRLCALLMLTAYVNVFIASYATLDPSGDDTNGTRNGLGSAAAFLSAEKQTEQATELMDTGLFRVASTEKYGRCDPMLFGYAGIENYASSENDEVLAVLEQLGVPRDWMMSIYNDQIPASVTSLLGVRYVISPDVSKSQAYTSLGKIHDQVTTVYENPNTLPILFPVSELVPEPDSGSNKFEYANNMWNAVAPDGGDIFRPVQVIGITRNDGSIDIDFRAQYSGPVCAFIPPGSWNIDGISKPRHQELFYVGSYETGESGRLRVYIDGDYSETDSIVLYSECIDVLEEKAREIQDQMLITVMNTEEISSSHLQLDYDADTEVFIGTTIPFDEGWTVRVDGQKIPISKNMDAFLSFKLPAGGHVVDLAYVPPGFMQGLVITILSAVGTATWSLSRHRCGMYKAQVNAEIETRSDNP